MLEPRWRKLLRDLWLYRGRTATMAAAVALGVFGLGTMLGAYAILNREISRNYLGTVPASATLELDSVTPALAAAVRARPGILAADAHGSVTARVRVGSDWKPLRIFVVPDFRALRIGIFRPVAGAWPPPDGTVLIERTAVPVLGAGRGGTLTVRTPHGAPREVRISGLVHDPGLAPATMEQTGYAYATPATLAALGEPAALNELRVVVAGPPDAGRIEAAARDLAAWLGRQGHPVREIEVPPPGRHPHQSQMSGILFLMIVFSLMTLVLGGILVATMVASLMARQVRETGVMKTIGAGSGQIAALYVAMVAGVAALAFAVAVPLGTLAARAFAARIAGLLNFTLYSTSVPGWVYAAQAAAGLLVPLLLTAVPLVRGSRITVREALDDHGVRADRFGARRGDGGLVRLAGFDRPLAIAVRNTFRRRGRLALTLGLLSAGGAMFMTARNVIGGWSVVLEQVPRTRHYDVEVRFTRPELVAPLVKGLGSMPGIRTVEAWGYAATSVARGAGPDVSHTYPDGGHGSFQLVAPPTGTHLVGFPLLAGRWLRAGDTDAVVLNQMALGPLRGAAVGSVVRLTVDGRTAAWRVAGIVEEVGSPAAAYVTRDAFARATGTEGRARMLRIATTARMPQERMRLVRAVESELGRMGARVSVAIPVAVLQTAMGEHMGVLVSTLVSIAVLMALVGGLGLMSTMSMNVLERTREIGVMQAVGATPAAVLRVIVGEGVLIGVMSWVAAVALSIPLTVLVGRMVGGMSFRTPLPLVVSPAALLGWLAAVTLGAALASGSPALRAARMTVREALAYA